MKIWTIGLILFLALVAYGLWKVMVFDIECGDIVRMLNGKIDTLEAELELVLEHCRKFHIDKP